MAAFQWAGVRSSGGVRLAAPALLTRMAIGPSARSMASTIRSAASGSIKSAATVVTSPSVALA